MSLQVRLSQFDHGGYYQPSNDWLFFYCLIPKNASSWTSQLFKHNGWLSSTLENCFTHDPNWAARARQHAEKPEIDNLIVALRDPVDRWIAGISQYLSSYVLNSHWFDRDAYGQGYRGSYITGKPNYTGSMISGVEFIENYNQLTERLLFDQIAFDDHTQPQSWFVDYFADYAKSHTWFYINDQFEQNFINNVSGDPMQPAPDPDYNRGNDNADIAVISSFLREQIYQKPYLRNNLERFYRADYELINRVDFTS